jgi:hypothetical protein
MRGEGALADGSGEDQMYLTRAKTNFEGGLVVGLCVEYEGGRFQELHDLFMVEGSRRVWEASRLLMYTID